MHCAVCEAMGGVCAVKCAFRTEAGVQSFLFVQKQIDGQTEYLIILKN